MGRGRLGAGARRRAPAADRPAAAGPAPDARRHAEEPPRGRPRQARRAHRARRGRPLDADVGVLRRQPRRGPRPARRAARRCCPEEFRHAQLLLADRESVRRRGPARGRSGSSPRPSEERDPPDLRDRGRAPQAQREAAPDPPRRRARRPGRMRAEVDDYVDSKLANFEVVLDKTIDRGTPRARQAAAAAPSRGRPGRPTRTASTAATCPADDRERLRRGLLAVVTTRRAVG